MDNVREIDVRTGQAKLDALNAAPHNKKRRYLGQFREDDTSALKPDLSLYASMAEIVSQSLDMTWIAEGLFLEGRIYQIFGQWKSGKTLVTTDCCAHLSLEWEWAGHRTKQCLVVYIAGESVDDIKARLQAFARHHKIDPDDMLFFLRQRPVKLTLEEQAALLHAEIALLREQHPGIPVVIVIDTLARNFGPGDENAQKDMTVFTDHIIDVVARPHGATTLIVHHSGHGDKDRSRGSSVLHGAIDGTLKVEKRDGRPATVVVSTQEYRSGDSGSELGFVIETYELPYQDNFGNPVVAPILRPTDDIPKRQAVSKGLGQTQVKTFEVLTSLYAQAHDILLDQGRDIADARIETSDWRQECENSGIVKSRQGFYDARMGLERRGMVRTDGLFSYPVA